MHLLVLSAFRLAKAARASTNEMTCLNAPSGAQCFPTKIPGKLVPKRVSGSQCTFWCSVLSDATQSKDLPK